MCFMKKVMRKMFGFVLYQDVINVFVYIYSSLHHTDFSVCLQLTRISSSNKIISEIESKLIILSNLGNY